MAEASRRVIDLGGNDTDQRTPDAGESLGAIVARTYVVGKISGDRRPHVSQIRSQMANVWYIKGDFRIIPKPNNVFLIGFELEEDKKKVLKGSPWLVSNMHFCLKGWFPDMILSQGTEPQVKGKEILRFDEEGGEVDGNSIAPNKKRKTVEADVQPPIQNAARRDHTGIMNTVAEHVSELHDASPIQASASKPSWKRMVRKVKVIYQPSTVELVQAFELEMESRARDRGEDTPQGGELTPSRETYVLNLHPSRWPFRLVFFLYQINAMFSWKMEEVLSSPVSYVLFWRYSKCIALKWSLYLLDFPPLTAIMHMEPLTKNVKSLERKWLGPDGLGLWERLSMVRLGLWERLSMVRLGIRERLPMVRQGESGEGVSTRDAGIHVFPSFFVFLPKRKETNLFIFLSDDLVFVG
ncbi:hypothetical protein Tsubulata_037668 [Turnera subulata]|uniref:DUF4283 domain-containing protein n=1 Tax=Turnera subulata TaxID=218843 RepID=A0A9Q0FFY7_9ROSI|nr:hypothetical protein Tsubulata_037668 [Turnera subulata]